LTIYVINLDRDTDRMRTFMELNCEISGLERFSAVNGNALDRDALVRDGLITLNLTYNNGQLGCAMSHIELWRRAVAEDRVVTAVEDDAILAPDFDTAHAEFTRDLPADWGIVLWGWNFNRSVWAEIPEGVANSVLQFDQDALRENLDVFRRARGVTRAPVRLRHAFGSLAYSVSPTGAKSLLELCLPLQRQFIRFDGFGIGIPNNGIDCMMLSVYPKLKSYICMPPLAVTENREEISRTYHQFG
jgi:glycosyl transferase family 25